MTKPAENPTPRNPLADDIERAKALEVATEIHRLIVLRNATPCLVIPVLVSLYPMAREFLK